MNCQHRFPTYEVEGVIVQQQLGSRDVNYGRWYTSARDYQVPGTPFFYVIDGEGVIRNAGFANTEEKLEALVEGNGE